MASVLPRRRSARPAVSLQSRATSMGLPRSAELEAALLSASEQYGLKACYRDCVRPLLGAPVSRWPSCCGRGCEPCATTLVAVAERVYELIGLDDESAQRIAREYEERTS